VPAGSGADRIDLDPSGRGAEFPGGYDDDPPIARRHIDDKLAGLDTHHVHILRAVAIDIGPHGAPKGTGR